jgi:uncharacterized protein YaaN involved in tellurite resistance
MVVRTTALPDAPLTILPFTQKDMDDLFGDVARNVGATTERIVSEMGVSRFGDMGAMLVQVQAEAENLDPDSIMKRGVAGWIQRRFGNVKAEMTLRLKKGEQVFDQLAAKIATHVTVQAKWVDDLEAMYAENWEQYKMLRGVIEKGESWKRSMEAQLANTPAPSQDDPDAVMKGQAIRDAQALLSRLKIKIDSAERLQAQIEGSAASIRDQQNGSLTDIQILNDFVEQGFPMLKREFVRYLQTLDHQKTLTLAENMRQLLTTTLTRSADSTKAASIRTAKVANAPLIQTSVLNHIRTRMIETVTEVRRIETDATAQREADAKTIAGGQAEYLKLLQSHGRV